MALCGQGADEPLGGYPRHVTERIYPYASHAAGPSRAIVGRMLGPDSADRLSRSMATKDRISRYSEIFSQMPAETIDALVPSSVTSAHELARAAVANWCSPEATDDSLNELLVADARLSLADDLLIIADRFSMKSGVELRVPFLDLQVLDLLERMPSAYKISRLGRRKWLYKRGAATRLPRDLSRRLTNERWLAPKRGFSFPEALVSIDRFRRDERSRRNALTVLPVNLRALQVLEAQAQPRQRALLVMLALWSRTHVAGHGQMIWGAEPFYA